jgi:glycosyltransferase involved in cell wall biosynthesis
VIHYVLDARTATDHFPGIGRYTASLARAMVPLLDEDERLILLCDLTRSSFWSLTTLTGEQVQMVDVPVSPFSLRQQWAIPRLLRHLRADLYHSPYYLMPYRPGMPTVVTVYDLIPLLFPQHASPMARLLFRWTTAMALRTAAHVITISQVTRRDLLAFYRLPPEKVMAIPLAADPCFYYPQPLAEVERVRRKYTLPEGYILYIGINKPHKNLKTLIGAWAQVRDSQFATHNWHLVIAGVWDSRYPEPRQRVEELGLENAVRFLGPVLEKDLPGLYAGAILFVFPSLYEGFGLPVLEAMACGTPVICSNTSSLPEITGEAALLVDPLEVDALASAIDRVLSAKTLRKELRDKGLSQVGNFSWRKTARETLKWYRVILER